VPEFAEMLDDRQLVVRVDAPEAEPAGSARHVSYRSELVGGA
jgi:hypothetical protein